MTLLLRPQKTLNGSYANEGPWNLSFSSFNLPLLKSQLRVSRNLPVSCLHRNVKRTAGCKGKCIALGVRYTWVRIPTPRLISYLPRDLVYFIYNRGIIFFFQRTVVRIIWDNYVKVLAYNKCLEISQSFPGKGIFPAASVQAFPRSASYLLW